MITDMRNIRLICRLPNGPYFGSINHWINSLHDVSLSKFWLSYAVLAAIISYNSFELIID